MFMNPTPAEIEQLASVLVDEPANSVQEVLRRCQATDALAAVGPAAAPAVPALRRTLVVPVAVDCALILRVAAAAALWEVEGNWSVAMPFLAWALKDEHWGVAPRALGVIAQIGHAAVVPDLIRLAERRLAHGPFQCEELSPASEDIQNEPLLATIAHALGCCGRGRWEGATYTTEARDVLSTMARCEDQRVSDSARAALAMLIDVSEQD